MTKKNPTRLTRLRSFGTLPRFAWEGWHRARGVPYPKRKQAQPG